MQEINIVYIDDCPDTDLVKYLRDEYNYKGIKKQFHEVKFQKDYSYEQLLNNRFVQSANIIVIDSKLFEDSHVTIGKFTGEEFQLILKKEFSFTEVIIISQNELSNNKYVKKFDGDRNSDGKKYYKETLEKKIDELIENILYYRDISDKFKKNINIDKRLVEKILESLDGINTYDEFKKTDVDQIISLFGEIQKHYEK